MNDALLCYSENKTERILREETVTKAKVSAFDELWESTRPAARPFVPEQLAGLPDPARRYLAHAIAPGTGLASAVRLRMHGEIKLKTWYPFTAEQAIHRERGMIWQANTRMFGIPISGFDRVVDGRGEMQWKLLGLIPVMSGSGPDITRSAAGRVAGEVVWLPSAFILNSVPWTETGGSYTKAGLRLMGEKIDLLMNLTPDGGLESVQYKRWGNPGGGAFHYADFGGFVEEEGTFEGYTIPTRMRLGWHFGTERYESEGEFFRVVIDAVKFR